MSSTTSSTPPSSATPSSATPSSSQSKPMVQEMNRFIYLNYQNQLVPELLKTFASFNRIPLSNILSDVMITVSENPTYYDHVLYINFSMNSLIDSDAPMLATIIPKLRSSSSYELYNKHARSADLVVDLSHNRFHGHQEKYKNLIDPSLLIMLQLCFVSVLNLVGNPIASIDRVDFFIVAYKHKLLQKIIFIDGTIPGYTDFDRVLCKFMKDVNLNDKDKEEFIKISSEVHSNYFQIKK